MMFSFNVGNKEKHNIQVEWKYAKLSIKVDHIPVQERFFAFYIPGKQEYNFEVGNKEKHKINILVSRHFTFLGGYFKFDVIIDGKFYNSYND